ncbi:carbohydrate ABC transporter permease [Paenibacillus sp.]|uniref:carbohydrate ABC transporter permease n=1 Tax=Paenibacillus sp. TaxID=58172 RepID=UPI002D2F2526|nr:carbohydrate ABC transporter permease [Paenibacillus sp.]HZG86362.1 carbohydrate ABC transporter permease [Paenibacillus sp.]
MKKKPLDEIVFLALGYPFVAFFALLCLVPFLMIISSSFTREEFILQHGYTLFPREFNLEGYRLIFKTPMTIFQAYGVTMLVTAVGTALGILISTMTGYVLQRPDFSWRNSFSFYLFFTTLFNGGLVPWYILITQYLHLKDTLWALIIPSCVSVWNILLAKGFIRGIPYAITESAKIDGCGDFKIFWLLILPLSKPVIATIGLFTALMYWNDWYHAMLFITDKSLYPLQYFLYKLLGDIQEMRRVMEEAGLYIESFPVESMKMALTIVVTGPIIFLYPFVQRFFLKGLTIGSVKG